MTSFFLLVSFQLLNFSVPCLADPTVNPVQATQSSSESGLPTIDAAILCAHAPYIAVEDLMDDPVIAKLLDGALLTVESIQQINTLCAASSGSLPTGTS